MTAECTGASSKTTCWGTPDRFVHVTGRVTSATSHSGSRYPPLAMITSWPASLEGSIARVPRSEGTDVVGSAAPAWPVPNLISGVRKPLFGWEAAVVDEDGSVVEEAFVEFVARAAVDVQLAAVRTAIPSVSVMRRRARRETNR